MASPGTLALRARMDALSPTPVYLDQPQAAPRSAPGEFKTLLAEAVRLSGARRRRVHADLVTANDTARGITRTVPVGGPGRRRAKALRNKRAVETCIHRHDARRCDQHAVADTVRCARHTRPAAGMLTRVLEYCAAHPVWPLPPFGDLAMTRRGDEVWIEGDVPSHIAITAMLLEQADPRFISFHGDTLTLNVRPEALHYRPLGPDRYGYTVVFERVTDKRD